MEQCVPLEQSDHSEGRSERTSQYTLSIRYVVTRLRQKKKKRIKEELWWSLNILLLQRVQRESRINISENSYKENKAFDKVN